MVAVNRERLRQREQINSHLSRLKQRVFKKVVIERLLMVWATLILLTHAFMVQHETDDLFISLRYAQNLATGLGPVFNVAEAVEGYTTPLWVFVLGTLARLGAPLLLTAKLLGLLGGMVTLWLLPQVARAWKWPGGMLATLLLALNTTFAVWTMAAMEMTLFSALLLAALWALGTRRWSSSGFLFGLAVLTRPEGSFWLGISLLWLLWHQREARQVVWRPAAQILGAAALLVVPHELWRLAYYGEPLPNTFYNKVGLSSTMLRRGLDYLGAAAWDYRLALTPFLAVTPLIPALWRKGGSLFFTLLLGQLAYVLIVGGDWMVAYRFLVPAVPLMLLLVARMLCLAFNRMANDGKRLLAASAILLFLALNLLTAVHWHTRLQPDWFFIQRWVPDGRLIAATVETSCEPRTSLAVFAVGALGYYALDYRIIDMFGLVTPEVNQTPGGVIGQGMAGHERFNAVAVRAMQPDLYVFHAELDQAPIQSEAGWREGHLAHLIQQFTDDPTFWAEYGTRTLELEPGRYWNFVARHDAPCQWE
ncbi:MAG: hypothetical protein M3220_17900 [Chloroflexota bacterium]|nr:hypothetical protein [Chloroflexota bacterium]